MTHIVAELIDVARSRIAEVSLLSVASVSLHSLQCVRICGGTREVPGKAQTNWMGSDRNGREKRCTSW